MSALHLEEFEKMQTVALTQVKKFSNGQEIPIMTTLHPYNNNDFACLIAIPSHSAILNIIYVSIE